jgi:hypothetical protein
MRLKYETAKYGVLSPSLEEVVETYGVLKLFVKKVV